MIAWTTPTIPIVIEGVENVTPDMLNNLRIEITIAQDCNQITLEPTNVTPRDTTSIVCELNLTQLQTGGFHAGGVHVQANLIDTNDLRAASTFKDVMIGSNLLPKVVNYAD